MARGAELTNANVGWAKRSLVAVCALTGLSACVQIAGIEEPMLDPGAGGSGAAGTGGMAGASGGGGGIAGTAGMAGAGGGVLCEPGAKKACYSGPVETANIGNCKPGTQTCLADGTTYGACVGEVLPAVEDCAAVGDEDCDGLKEFEDSECVCVPGMISACATNMLGVCATGTGVCSADGKSFESCVQDKLPSPENCATPEDDDCDGTAAAACTGNPKWNFSPAGSVQTPYDDSIFSVALTPDGGYVIAGVVDGTIGGDAFGVTAGKAYIAKLDANKALVWEKKYTATTFAVARGIAVDKDGNVIVTGSFSGSMTIEQTNLMSSIVDIFMVKFDPAGMVLWSKAIAAPKIQNAFAVAVDAAANIYITGSTDDPVDFGGGSLPVSGVDVFVASYGPGNAYRWSKIYPSLGNQFGRGITTTANGDVVFIGDTGDNIDLGGGIISKGGNQDIFVARYAGTDGSHVWSKLYGKAGDQVGRGIAMAPAGNVLITGGFAGTIDWATNTSITAVGTYDVYVAELDGANGNHFRSAGGGKLGISIGTSIGADESGNVMVFGYFNDSIDFGGQSISTGNLYDAFLVKLRAWDWKPVWTKPYGTAGNQYGWDVAVAKDGGALIGGGFYTELVVPPLQKINSTGGSDLFAVRIDP